MQANVGSATANLPTIFFFVFMHKTVEVWSAHEEAVLPRDASVHKLKE